MRIDQVKGLMKGSGSFTKVLQLVVVEIFALIATMLIAAVFTNTHAESTNSFKIVQLIQSLFVFVIPPLILAFLWSDHPSHYLYLDKLPKGKPLFFVVLTMLVLIPFVNLMTSINQQMTLPGFLSPVQDWMKSTEDKLDAITQQILNVHGFSLLFFNVIVIALIPAIGEELFFRGTIQKLFTERKKVVSGIWLTAIIFSTFHMQFYGFVPRMLLGAFFGYLLVWGESLWLPITAHFTNNVAAIIFYYLKYNGVKVVDIDAIGTGNTMWVGFLSAILGVLGIFLIRKTILNNQGKLKA